RASVRRSFPTRRSSDLISAVSLSLMDVQANLAGSTMAGVAAGGTFRAASLTATATGDAVAFARTFFIGFSIAGGAGSLTTATLRDRKSTRLHSSHVAIS